MRRIICLLLVLCLLPIAAFAETEKQPMDGMIFLHRMICALRLLGAANTIFSFDPIYRYDPVNGYGYLQTANVLITLNHLERTVVFADAYFVDAESQIIDDYFMMLPAFLFAVSPLDLLEEQRAFKEGRSDSYLLPFKDPAIVKDLISKAQQAPLVMGEYYLTANQERYSLFLKALSPDAVSPVYTSNSYIAASDPGQDCYCLYIRYLFAQAYLHGTYFGYIPQLIFASSDYISYWIGPNLNISTQRADGIGVNLHFAYPEPLAAVPHDELLDIIAFYFALSDRSMSVEFDYDNENSIVFRNYTDEEARKFISDNFFIGNQIGQYNIFAWPFDQSGSTFIGAGNDD